ncbi:MULTISPECIES: DUF4307 domain-containing protein [Streptomyces]|uniref:Membrane protein n=1 Tax=Streptomyces fradiae ATCC 10745 = DSM 40063 TaxID=1319510 RepID=A0A1Y2NYS4_STRFR|nr:MULTISPECIES: DUF4307 domain-containing protein [Streptomyces]KAF0649475.1 membrane protein [Streptomyces fradiae ATCC 10745 = DSM 40063]OSY52683.1 hypothetical protein BG846_01672 [Streptomyces fradiae ATCC 10745 = DSM 40063]QEV13846.1 DUF4307 domain-containing protein [Streptomyces fradiae ATCC 10745 = DSM 40063]UQS30911.1 DUF4307 domain-containing protein [Streptomyces fradiae]
MGVTGERLPEGRYGRAAEARADRGLKIAGAVLGAGLLALIGWFGYDYIAGQKVSGEMIKFDIAAADRVDVHLEVRKADGAKGYCTVRALAESGAEVGRKEVRFDQAAARIDEVVAVRTTERATAAQLLGCTAD